MLRSLSFFLILGLLQASLALKNEGSEWAQKVKDVLKRIGSPLARDEPLPQWFSDLSSAPFSTKSSHYSSRPRRARTKGQIVEEIEDFVKGLMSCSSSLGLTLSIVHNDELLLAKGFGLQSAEAQIPVDEHTLFGIGSTSKAFTSTLVAMVIDDDHVGWDAPVTQHLPEFHLANQLAEGHANARDLLAHKVGLPRHDLLAISNPKISREELIRRLQHLPFSQDFREEFLYNNLMVFTAGFMASELSQVSWEELLSERLLKPLNMTRTTPGVEGALLLGNLASCYGRDVSGRRILLPDDVNQVITLVGPAGAIHSNAVDMAHWLRFQLRGGVSQEGRRLVSRKSLFETRARQFAGPRVYALGGITEPLFPTDFFLIDYAFGWWSGVYHGRRTLSHSGSTLGHTSLVFLLPDEAFGIFLSGNEPLTDLNTEMLISAFAADVVLGLDPWLDVPSACNFPCSFVNCSSSSSSSPFSSPSAAALQEAHQLRANLPSSSLLPSSALEEYVGAYFDPGYDSAFLSFDEDGELFFRFNEIKGKVIALGERDTLFALPEYWYNLFMPILPLEFKRDPQGKILSLIIAAFEPKAPPVFFKQMS